ncbi:nitric oxide reductase transcriptional regulator NorR [Desulfogranum mediterraneum]|uniref:nitric oxide reductase transcriptional regulator NorR n=1 Tax=Desulfogranum mediterraneum TaxID=160661 RepID=UPI000429BA39|nr:nitric oxide reductase transcriptional regulator NorR [Desulfogranum mediterraneum]
MKKLETLSAIATDLTAVLTAEDRYTRLLEALHLAIPYDSAALLRVEEEQLLPLAAKGLLPAAMATVFKRSDHPRLDIICSSREPTLFSSDSSLPDPFDGLLLAGSPDSKQTIHACMGCPLWVREQLVGVLVFDAVEPSAFAHLPLQYVEVIAALAGAQIQTVGLLSGLEREARHQGQLASDLMQDIQQQRGREILGNSPAIRKLRREIELVAGSDFTVLILGETGVGKELVARAIHSGSPRSDRPLLYLNCAALPASLAESELFGHRKGAFTGAVKDRAGKFELAHGGTLFLDEIGELSLAIQAKILRTIQEGEVQRLGSEKMIHVEVRLLAATNRNLEEEVAAGRFRADLYHRLNVYPLEVPPLRERKDDIGLLAAFFAEKTKGKLAIREITISQEAQRLLLRYRWPGNVRELENVISRSVLKASAGAISGESLLLSPLHLSADLSAGIYTNPDPPRPSPPSPTEGRSGLSLRDEVKAFQVELIKRALNRNQGNWAAAARDLAMNRSNLHNLATRLGIRERGKQGRTAG